MRRAADAGGGRRAGRVDAACTSATCCCGRGASPRRSASTRWAQAADPNDMAAVAALGRARLTAGDPAGAIPFYERAVERYPLPELVVALGDLYEAVGRPEDAARQHELARGAAAARRRQRRQRRPRAGAVRGRAGRRRRGRSRWPAPRSTAATASTRRTRWPGRSTTPATTPRARAASQRALRLGTRDGLMLFHAGMIELKLGNDAAGRSAARRGAGGRTRASRPAGCPRRAELSR